VPQYDLYGLSFCCKYRVAVGETNPGGGSIHQREATLMFMTPACSDLQASSPSKDKLDCSQFSRCLWDLQCIVICYEVCNYLKHHRENIVKKKPPRKKTMQFVLWSSVLWHHIPQYGVQIFWKNAPPPSIGLPQDGGDILLQNAGMHLLDHMLP